MEFELRCNRLTCRKPLSDKAVVTTCSHVFCVDCANELFTDSRLCPACETSLTEPDDVVVSSLNPTNDYKTSVLSGLNPAAIFEICTRAVQFWSYQNAQELAFQNAVLRNVNDKNAQLQKQLDNVVREANSEIALVNNKLAELERDRELDRRKIRELQDGARERDKEYQKLKVQCDKLKKKALLAPNAALPPHEAGGAPPPTDGGGQSRPARHENAPARLRHAATFPSAADDSMDVNAVVEDMTSAGVQRTPLPNWQGKGRPFAPAWPQRAGQAPQLPRPFAPEAHRGGGQGQNTGSRVTDSRATFRSNENDPGGAGRPPNRAAHQVFRPTAQLR